MKKTKNQITYGISRRNFLKKSSILAAGSLVYESAFASALKRNDAIAIVMMSDDIIANATPPLWALGKLKSELEKQGSKVRVINNFSDLKNEKICIFVSGLKSTHASQICKSKNITTPTEPEALIIVQGKIDACPIPVLLTAGTDESGLVYALTELADRVNILESGTDALEFTKPVIERPASRIRSIMRQFTSELEDKKWFYDRENWIRYLDMLVYSRVNRMSFTTGMAYNSARDISDGYFVFPYPFFLDIPGYDVKATGLSAEERERNLDTLKFIGEETVRRGLRFQLGIWTVAYKWVKSDDATYQIEGLSDETHASYCRDALALLLEEVPTISGITFRVHGESGVALGNQNFWETQFSAIANCGRTVEIDMHAKNMEPETLELALATGQPTVISPKYCGEHLSLPYHQSSIREKEMSPEGSLKDTGTGVLIGNRNFTRYGYADTLAENRTWDVVFRIWPGTQRFLLNGDPVLFAGYGRHAAMCGAAGIELSGPLDFKGRCGTGLPGGRCAYKDESLIPAYDFEKYNYSYRLWGRLGYNPDSDPEVWQRVLKKAFGEASLAIENALGKASRVLPLFTLAHGPSANCRVYWPEIYSNIPIADTGVDPFPEVSDPLVFGNVSSFDPQLFMSGIEYGTALVNNEVTARYSPVEVASWLENIANESLKQLDNARILMETKVSKPEFRRIEEDVLIQCGLALFFAAKLRCSVLWCIYSLSNYLPAGEAAIEVYDKGLDEWKKMANRAEKVYLADITYGPTKRLGGDWMSRIPDFEADIADLKKRLNNSGKLSTSSDTEIAKKAMKIALSEPQRPEVSLIHIPSKWFKSGKNFPISLECKSSIPKKVLLYYRHVNQAERWQSIEMKSNGNIFNSEIPADYTSKRYPLQYYFEIQTDSINATLYPQLSADLSNTPYFIVRRQ